MSRYILELRNSPIGTENIQVASHLYWAIKDTQTGLLKHVFHGGAFNGENNWEKTGFYPDKTKFSDKTSLTGQDSNESIPVMEISESELESVINVINSVGTEINNMGESYVLLGDNSNSVAYLLGRAIGLSDEQLLALESKMTTGLAGAPGFGDDLLDGGDGEHAGLTVEEFLEKAKESGVLTDEQISQLQKLEEQLSDKFPAGIDEEDHQSDEAQIGKAIADLIKQYQHHDSDLEEFLSDAVIETLMQNAGEVAYYLRQGASLENAVSNAKYDLDVNRKMKKIKLHLFCKAKITAMKNKEKLLNIFYIFSFLFLAACSFNDLTKFYPWSVNSGIEKIDVAFDYGKKSRESLNNPSQCFKKKKS